MARTSTGAGSRSGCPIATTLDILGDKWSLLVVRDLMFRGCRTFKEFADAGEGIATNVLSERLERLECAGILSQRRDEHDGRRVVYRLTRKGMALAPVLVEIVLWAARHEQTDAPPAMVRRMKADRDAFVAELYERWRADG